MKTEGWPPFSFTDVLRPAEGWQVDHAILTAYSADLVVVVSSLLVLSGSNLDQRRTGSRVEFVNALNKLQGRFRVLAQSGRVLLPKVSRSILKTLDKFVLTIETDENVASWHPKIVLVRYQSLTDQSEYQWRIWIGSRNLTRSTNWEAGLTLLSRADDRGQKVAGLAELGAELATKARLANFTAKTVSDQLGRLTWECPPGCEVQSVNILGPDFEIQFPAPPATVDRTFVVSPFLDAKTIKKAATWGGPDTRRTLVSTRLELQRLWQENNSVFSGYYSVRAHQNYPDLPAETIECVQEGDAPPDEALIDEENEEDNSPPAGLHAKLYYAAKGKERYLWVGSANATQRGWAQKNHEVVARLKITSRDIADALEAFVADCAVFKPSPVSIPKDQDEEGLELARKCLSAGWGLKQLFNDSGCEIVAPAPPPIADATITLEIAVLGGAWTIWPLGIARVDLIGPKKSERSDFLQLRLTRGQRRCAWVQIAPCHPMTDELRDRSLIARYLDARTFILWLRSIMADDAKPDGEDWDSEDDPQGGSKLSRQQTANPGVLPTVEEILKSWARDPESFRTADQKVSLYLVELQRRAEESQNIADRELLNIFQRTWESLAAELR
jgi:hypothetical protein